MDYKYEKEKWYKIDILLEWEDKNVAIFIDGIFLRTVAFYSLDRDDLMDCGDAFVNTLMVYNLTPGTTTAFRDIRLCDYLCPGT